MEWPILTTRNAVAATGTNGTIAAFVIARRDLEGFGAEQGNFATLLLAWHTKGKSSNVSVSRQVPLFSNDFNRDTNHERAINASDPVPSKGTRVPNGLHCCFTLRAAEYKIVFEDFRILLSTLLDDIRVP
jgi:hypothetical protein